VLKNIKDPNEIRQILLSLLSTSGTLAGISLALVGIVAIKVSNSKVETIADDLFLFSSLGFVIVCYFIFFALRRIHSPRAQFWTTVIDFMFLMSLTMLVLAGFVTVYTFL
jgi:nitrate reductase gamma subunit